MEWKAVRSYLGHFYILFLICFLYGANEGGNVMDYIINPWWFYLIDAIDKIHLFALMIVFIGAIITAFFCIGNYDKLIGSDGTRYPKNTENDIKMTRLIVKVAMFIIAVSSAVYIITPSQDTMNKMLIANVLTKQNIEAGTDFTQDQIDKLVDKIADAAVKVKASDRK